MAFNKPFLRKSPEGLPDLLAKPAIGEALVAK
jgi:hypothetical protein